MNVSEAKHPRTIDSAVATRNLVDFLNVKLELWRKVVDRAAELGDIVGTKKFLSREEVESVQSICLCLERDFDQLYKIKRSSYDEYANQQTLQDTIQWLEKELDSLRPAVDLTFKVCTYIRDFNAVPIYEAAALAHILECIKRK